MKAADSEDSVDEISDYENDIDIEKDIKIENIDKNLNVIHE